MSDSQQSKIEHLSSEARSFLRSGVALTSFTQCIEELVYNSIDAKSTCIAVRVDFTNYRIEVLDNGEGISKDNLKRIGSRYNTSKAVTLEDYQKRNLLSHGYRGEALSSMRQVSSLVQITSQTARNETYISLFVKGKRHPIEKALKSRGVNGTTVIVKDFYYTLPVRQKCMKPTIEMADTLASLKALALSHPTVSITLRDESTGEVEFQSFVSHSIEEAYGHLFQGDDQTLVSFKRHQNTWRVKGFFGTNGYHDKSKQFMFVNRRWMKRCKFIKKISNFFKNTGVDRNDANSPRSRGKTYPVFLVFLECPLSEVEMTLEPRKMLLEFEHPEAILSFIQNAIEEELKSHNLVMPETNQLTQDDVPKSGKVLHNVTGICALSQGPTLHRSKLDRLKSSYGTTDFGGARKSLAVSKNVLLNQTGKKHFVDAKGLFRKTSGASSTVTQGQQSLAPKEDLMSTILSFRSQFEEKYNFSRNDYCVPQESQNDLESLKKTSASLDSSSLQESLNSDDCRATEKDINFRQGMDSAREHILKYYETDTVVWEDESSNNFIPSFEFTEPPTDTDEALEASSECKESNSSMQSRLSNAKNTFIEPHSKSAKRMLMFEADDSKPLDKVTLNEEALKSPKRKRPWPLPSGTSPYMRGQKLKIDSVTVKPNVSSKIWENPNFQSAIDQSQKQSGSWRDNPIFQKSFNLKKKDLANIVTIGQVEDKFIATLLNGTYLCLFDQHALHERIRLERLLSEHFTSTREVLKGKPHQPVPLYIGTHEQRILMEYPEKVRRFGLSLETDPSSECMRANEVPACFLQRQASEHFFKRPSQLQSLVKELALELVQTLVDTKGAVTVLPRAILNVINSQACRGAIMFGDKLSLEECKFLLSEISHCHTPFQCAHGRPSVAPILSLEKLSTPSSYSSTKIRFSRLNVISY